jgi:hypothetical protein
MERILGDLNILIFSTTLYQYRNPHGFCACGLFAAQKRLKKDGEKSLFGIH